MAIPFLNNINLSDNQLLNAKLHVTSTAPTAAAAQIYFDSTSSDLTAKYYSNSTDLWVSLKEYSFPTGNYVTGAVTGTTPKPIITFDLNALDGTASAGERYLTKTNKWAEISTIPGTYTWTVSDGSNSEAIASGDTVTWSGTGTTTVTYATASNTFTINSADQYVGTVTNVDAGTGLVIESGTSTVDPEIGIDYSGVDNYILSAGSVTDAAAADKINFNDADDNEVKQTTFGDIPIDALTEVKTYIDNSVAGGLIYQGGYNALTNTPDLTTSPNSIEKGWTYTVTADGTFFGEQLRVGDVIIAEVDDPSALSDWTTVQNNIDLASLTQVGIGNVNAEPAGNLGGIAVSYNAGTAKVGLGIAALGVDPLTETPADYFIPIYNAADDENKKVASSDLLNAINSATSYAKTITDTDTNILHGLNTSDVMVQLYDVTTGETVYADVERISATRVGVTFSATPTNSVRVLVQKIG
jgi:hypothetical protein